MDGHSAARAGASPTGQRPIFLHSGWRSAGTWIWSRLRSQSDVLAFCEPLHETLATIHASTILDARPDGWDSRHPDMRPYFEEYAPLLRRGGGVAGFRRAFSFDRFFAEPHERNWELADYVADLTELARDAGKVPVLKFARSHGRVGWMRRHFPEALHVVIVRDPLQQWISGWRLARGGTPYFLAAPLAILARERGNPLVEPFVRRLNPTLGTLCALTYRGTYRRCLQYAAQASPQTLYRSSLAYWLCTGMAALTHAELVLDSDELVRSASYREMVSRDLREASGLSVSFAASHVRPPAVQPAVLGDDATEEAHAAAAEALRSLIVDSTPAIARRAAALLRDKLVATRAAAPVR